MRKTLPTAALLAFMAGPILYSLYLAFTDYNIFTAPKWSGLANFERMAGDTIFWGSVQITLIYVLVGTPIKLAAALGEVALERRQQHLDRVDRELRLLQVAARLLELGVGDLGEGRDRRENQVGDAQVRLLGGNLLGRSRLGRQLLVGSGDPERRRLGSDRRTLVGFVLVWLEEPLLAQVRAVESFDLAPFGVQVGLREDGSDVRRDAHGVLEELHLGFGVLLRRVGHQQHRIRPAHDFPSRRAHAVPSF